MSEASQDSGPTRSLETLRSPRVTDLRGRIIDTMVQNVSGFDPDLWVAMDERDNALIQDELLHGVGSSAFVYQFPHDGATVSGISVIGARELAAHYQGIKHRVMATTSKVGPLFITQSYDPPRPPFVEVIDQLASLPDYFEVVCEVTDVKTGNSIQETAKEYRMERRSRNALRDNPNLPEEFERKHYEKIAASKAYRNGVLHLIRQSVQLEWKALMLKAGKSQVVTGSQLEEKRSGVLRYAASKAISVDRRAIESLTLDQISGLSDAAREGLEGFIASAEALGIVAGAGSKDRQTPSITADPREEIKRRVAEEAAAEQAAKAAAADAAEQAKKADGAPGKGKRAPDPTLRQAEDKTAERAQELIAELATIDGTDMESALTALLARGTTGVVLRAVERDPDLNGKVRDAIVAARKRVEPKQNEPPEDNRFPGDR